MAKVTLLSAELEPKISALLAVTKLAVEAQVRPAAAPPMLTDRGPPNAANPP